MKCTNCGFETEQCYTLCPQCQAAQPNYAGQAILRALKDPLFLVVCILISATAALSVVAGNLPVIEILFTVFLWLVYSKSSKGIADAKQLRCVSGTVYANYVITYVVAVLLAVVGMILAVALKAVLSDPALLDSLGLYTAFAALTLVPSGLVTVVFVIMAVVIVVLNYFSFRYIHRFAKSVYQSIETGKLELQHTTAAMVWLFIFGGLSGIGCLSSLTNVELLSALISAANCGACIIAGLLIKNHLTDLSAEPEIPQQIAE